MTPNSDGNYQASFNIGTGTSGQLVVYASDTTGNKSVSSKLKLNEYVEFIEADEDENGWYYKHALQLSKEIVEIQNVLDK